MNLDTNNHSVFLLNYQLVLVIKYRRKVITDEVSNRLKEIFEYICPVCGMIMETDINASKNLLKLAM